MFGVTSITDAMTPCRWDRLVTSCDLLSPDFRFSPHLPGPFSRSGVSIHCHRGCKRYFTKEQACHLPAATSGDGTKSRFFQERTRGTLGANLLLLPAVADVQPFSCLRRCLLYKNHSPVAHISLRAGGHVKEK